MSIRPHDGGRPPTPDALRRWPKPPQGFSDVERDAWGRIGEALMVLGTASAADLPVAERAAQVRARVDALFADDELKPSTLASMLRIEVDLYKQLGLSPQARRQVSPLPDGKDRASGFEDIE